MKPLLSFSRPLSIRLDPVRPVMWLRRIALRIELGAVPTPAMECDHVGCDCLVPVHHIRLAVFGCCDEITLFDRVDLIPALVKGVEDPRALHKQNVATGMHLDVLPVTGS
jgi:hypothetical protein